MYVRPNFKTKKALREAVARGEKVEVFSPGPFPAPGATNRCTALKRLLSIRRSSECHPLRCGAAPPGEHVGHPSGAPVRRHRAVGRLLRRLGCVGLSGASGSVPPRGGAAR